MEQLTRDEKVDVRLGAETNLCGRYGRSWKNHRQRLYKCLFPRLVHQMLLCTHLYETCENCHHQQLRWDGLEETGVIHVSHQSPPMVVFVSSRHSMLLGFSRIIY